MTAQTYCGKPRQDAVGDWWVCNSEEGPCPSCLREHVAKLEAALSTAEAAYAESLEARRVTEAEGGALNQANNEIDRLRARNEDWETRLSAVMPADFKDWHQNSRNEWPEVAAAVIENLRERVEEAEAQAAAQAGGVVPELTLVDVIEAVGSVDDSKSWQAIADDLNAKIRAVPASRVLGEGFVAVLAEELSMLRELLKTAIPVRNRAQGLDFRDSERFAQVVDALRAVKGGDG